MPSVYVLRDDKGEFLKTEFVSSGIRVFSQYDLALDFTRFSRKKLEVVEIDLDLHVKALELWNKLQLVSKDHAQMFKTIAVALKNFSE